MTMTEPHTTEHTVTTERRLASRRRFEFRCVCTCGETSEWFGASGFAAGWEGRHTGKDPVRGS